MSNDDIFITPSEQAKQVRAKCPSAYALTVNEAIRISRIDTLIWLFFDTHPEFIREQEVGTAQDGQPIKRYARVFDDNSVQMIKAQLRRHRISLDNAYAVAQRVLTGHWFYLIGILNLTGDPSQGLMSVYLDGESQGAISREEFPSFYEIYEAEDYSNAEGLRQALRLEDDYKLLCSGEWESLRLIKIIAEYVSTPVTVYKQQEGYLTIKSTPQTTALIGIGSKSIREAEEHYDELNDMYTLTSTSGQHLYIKGRLITSKERVSLDKLLTQFNYKALETNYSSKVITITLDEFMEARKLKDRRDAREELKKVIELSYNVSCEFEGRDDKGKPYKISVRYLQAKGTIDNSVATFMLTDIYFDHLKSSGSIAYRPKAYLAMDGKSDNAYAIGVFLSDQRRRNLESNKADRVSIGKLLEVTSLPSAKDINTKYYRRQIILPFFDALNKAAHAGGFTYQIVHAGGTPLDQQEAVNVQYDYPLFIASLIQPTWDTEPEYYTELRQRKDKEAQARARGKLKGIESAAKKQAEAQAAGKPIKKK